ncbi:hypothetical protein [Halobacterium sp. R2-5]|uniref:hypothetical protein n=1 Tax=Halobacterium sp. R2-5 TaxID=2715751 RepID=UPI00141E4079|nr:hypothetical protein [Halobacterium sp. R2-5]NIB99436.1 hypothetical protein [Halobacterium sp. R2-5]
MDGAAHEPSPESSVASNRDGLLALVLAQLTLLTLVVAASFDTPGVFVQLAYASALLVGLPAFVAGVALLAPNLD